MKEQQSSPLSPICRSIVAADDSMPPENRRHQTSERRVHATRASSPPWTSPYLFLHRSVSFHVFSFPAPEIETMPPAAVMLTVGHDYNNSFTAAVLFLHRSVSVSPSLSLSLSMFYIFPAAVLLAVGDDDGGWTLTTKIIF